MEESRTHTMTLEEYAALSGKPFPPEAAPCTIVTPALAEALDTLVETAHEVADGVTSRSALRVALGQLKVLHDYERVRLGGRSR